ncbi:hypothetical protein [Burkholderia cepacia]|nr:hypothetical protein [Burkholderia cepacia]
MAEVWPKRPGDEPNIDPLSALAYRAKNDAGFRAWLDSHTEE